MRKRRTSRRSSASRCANRASAGAHERHASADLGRRSVARLGGDPADERGREARNRRDARVRRAAAFRGAARHCADDKLPIQRPPPALPHDDAPRQAGGGLQISPPRPVARPQLDWLSAGPALQARPLGRAHSPAPLFRPQWTRAILSASLSARRPIGAPDLARAVEVIARGQALLAVPRRPALTLARGVQALIDIGDNMQPFWQDRAVLRRDLKRIVGDGGLEILECIGSPRKTRRDDRFEGRDYEARFPPQLDACVLIVSDFGIGSGSGVARGASPYSWAMLARRLARRGHRVVGFVPYPPARWPSFLSRAVDLVSWDRATTAGRISLSRTRSAPA
jgi:hypothetical protein